MTSTLSALALMSVYGGDASAAGRERLRCRGAIAANLRALATAGFRALDACHARRDAGHLKADCNTLFTATPPPRAFATLLAPYSIARERARGIIGANCGTDLLGNYPNVTGSKQIVDIVGHAMEVALQTSGTAVQGTPDLAGQGTAARSRRRCHAVIGRTRSRVALSTIRRAARCERRLDPSRGVLGQIDAGCLAGASDRVVARARAQVTRACADVGGPAVGSCAALPGCLIADAVRTGETLLRDFYGGTPAERRALCGNGLPDLGEECDDGNTDPNDACTDTCQVARCGDGIVETGVEQCDDGNRVNDDGCSNKCTSTSCGDGVVQAGEECDDGNDVPNDGCTGCVLDPVPCTADGIEVTVSLCSTQSTAQSIGGVTVELTYSPPLEIPGSGAVPSVHQRVADLTPPSDQGNPHFSFVSDLDQNHDGVDDTLRNVYATSSTPPKNVPFGPFERVQFDCPPGTPVRSHDIVCAMETVDSLGQKNDSSAAPACVFGLAPKGGTPNRTCLGSGR